MWTISWSPSSSHPRGSGRAWQRPHFLATAHDLFAAGAQIVSRQNNDPPAHVIPPSGTPSTRPPPSAQAAAVSRNHPLFSGYLSKPDVLLQRYAVRSGPVALAERVGPAPVPPSFVAPSDAPPVRTVMRKTPHTPAIRTSLDPPLQFGWAKGLDIKRSPDQDRARAASLHFGRADCDLSPSGPHCAD